MNGVKIALRSRGSPRGIQGLVFTRQGKGQTFVEYIALMGIVMMVIIAISPMIRRFAQGIVKLTADQIGNQRNSDQEGGEGGYLINAYVASYDENTEEREDRLGDTTYRPSIRGERHTVQHSNLGFTDNGD